MKYIRTKDGIFEVANEITITEFQVIDHLHNRAFLKDKIIAQADTIEELCDEFVVVFEDNHIMTDLDYESFGKEWYKNNHIRMRNAQYYGAIWTSAGLIYVAKMNENGDFELI